MQSTGTKRRLCFQVGLEEKQKTWIFFEKRVSGMMDAPLNLMVT